MCVLAGWLALRTFSFACLRIYVPYEERRKLKVKEVSALGSFFLLRARMLQERFVS